MRLESDLSVRLGPHTARYRFTIKESVTGVFGPSGAGKTTMFRLLAGLTPPDSGRLTLNGETLYDAEQHVMVKPHRRSMGVMFQEARLFPHWNVEQNLCAVSGRHRAGRPDAVSFADVIECLQLEKLMSASVQSLSGGEQRRVALGRVLLSRPRLLLMDEPLAGLDESLKNQILSYLARINAQFDIPCLYISHDLPEIQYLTDHLVLLDKLHVVGQGTVTELVDQPSSRLCFGVSRFVNTLEGIVQRHDAENGVYEIGRPGRRDAGILYAALGSPPLSTAVKMSVSPAEIALAEKPVEQVSIQNQIPGKLLKIIVSDGAALCLVETAWGLLYVEVTRCAEHRMQLKPGRTVVCLVKATAFRSKGYINE